MAAAQLLEQNRRNEKLKKAPNGAFLEIVSPG